MVKWIMACVSTPSYSICINGERHGFFKGGRGLRQGDPMSPYLFTIVMEVFNLILQHEIRDDNGFKYHFRCKSLKITHLCFADDLLVLCHGDINSVNMERGTIESILDILPFKRGKLPVKYLGVPLVAKKIGVQDCKSLIDKVKAKIHDWKNKSLSYAGRAQLIASFLASIQVSFKEEKQKSTRKRFVSLSNMVKLINVVKLKGRSIWEIDKQMNDSWIWTQMPAINTILSRREILSAGFSNDASIADLPMLIPRKMDKLLWCSNTGVIHRFTSDQLVTQDKLAKWYPGSVWKCPLCIQVEDSHSHLFFEYEYSKKVWMEVQKKANVADLYDLEDCMAKMASLPCKNSIWSIVRRICVADTVYHLWIKRC
ncbi:RNA-directed DNA polymerase, eukaryota, reverse transcriptase zinc-binding domain protein [Tanacetum coccineum]